MALIHALLPDQREDTYLLLFQKLVSVCESLGLLFSPRECVLDFEIAAHNAISRFFPTTRLTGCRFHLGQAWWRQIQALGLADAYKNRESVVAIWLTRFFGLPFLHPDEVEESFAENIMSDAPQLPSTASFADYIVEQYIDVHARFPPSIWAGIPSNSPRTNNAAESYHRSLNAEFYMPHPNIFVLADTLLKRQAMTYIQLRSLRQRGRVYVDVAARQQFLETTQSKYVQGFITRRHSLQSISYRFTPVINTAFMI